MEKTEMLKVSRGNKKLVPNKNTNFIIWNLPARATCPGATKHCAAACYAVKAERAYKAVLPARRNNLNLTYAPDFVDRMTETIRRTYKNSRKPSLIVRIHESGDFYSAEYAGKWLDIAARCADLPGVHFIAYTKSFEFFDGVAIPENFSLRASVWDDTPARDLETIARNNWPVYTAVEKFTRADTFHQCRCEDCATCGKCWTRTPLIACEIH